MEALEARSRSLVSRISPAFRLTLLLLIPVLAAGAFAAGFWLGPDPEPIRLSDPAPELGGAVAWINSPPLTLAGLRGKVVIVHIWTYG